MNILFCGMPLSGKQETIKAISRLTSTNKIAYSEYRLAQIVSLEIHVNSKRIKLLGTTGAVFYKSEVYKELVSKADAICYLFSVDLTRASYEYQVDVFKEYIAVAQDLGKSWNQIPWVFLLTKVDLEPHNLFPVYVKSLAGSDFLKIAPIKNIGISDLWDKLMNLTFSEGK